MGESEERAGQGKRPLVTVERQTEHNVFTGELVERRFVKMYFEARESGLLADIPDDLWKTLCALATYIDNDGRCFPSQETLARDLGVGRQAVNARIRRLREYRFEGQPVLAVAKQRGRSRKNQSRFGSNVYHLLPIAGFNYGKDQRPEITQDLSVSLQRDTDPRISVSSEHDIEKSASVSCSMSPQTRQEQERTRKEHTHIAEEPVDPGENESVPVCVDVQDEEGKELRKQAVGLVRAFHGRIGAPKGRRPSERELEHARGLLVRLGADHARFVVGFALREAKKTGFSMRHFGAVMGYEADAEAAWEQEQKRRVRAEHDARAKREEALEARYWKWRGQVLKEALEAMEPYAREAAEAKVATELEREHGGRPRFGFDTLVRMNLEERIAAERGIPPFEQWRREDFPRLREAGLA